MLPKGSLMAMFNYIRNTWLYLTTVRKFPVLWRLSFWKYGILNFRLSPCMTPWHKAIWLEKNVYPFESQQFEPFNYIRRCVHAHVFYLMSEQWALSLQWLQMFSLITGRHIGGPHGVSIQVAWRLRQITQCTDLRIGEVVKRFVSYNIPNSWPFSLIYFELIFLLRDSETIVWGYKRQND